MILPPLKIQGKKTKLLENIYNAAESIFSLHPEIDTWVEPFMGTGVVAFNCPINIKHVICADINPHIIDFYNSIKKGEITAETIEEELLRRGKALSEKGKSYYLAVRDEFNKSHSPILFLFLSRTGFNGMMRFNKKGEWNIPYCNVDNRLNPKNVATLAEEINTLSNRINNSGVTYEFKCLDFRNLFKEQSIISNRDKTIFYCDPPYIGLYSDYYCGWSEDNEKELAHLLIDKYCIVSSWANNGIIDNPFIDKYWNCFYREDIDHFYNIAANSSNRRKVKETLLTNF